MLMDFPSTNLAKERSDQPSYLLYTKKWAGGGGCFFIVFCTLRFGQPMPHSVLKGRASRAMCRGHPYCGGRGSQFGEIADRLVGTTAFTSSLLAPSQMATSLPHI